MHTAREIVITDLKIYHRVIVIKKHGIDIDQWNGIEDTDKAP